MLQCPPSHDLVPPNHSPLSPTRQLLTYGERESPDDICAKIDAVTPEDILRVGQRLIASEPSFVTFGDLENSHMPPYDLVCQALALGRKEKGGGSE